MSKLTPSVLKLFFMAFIAVVAIAGCTKKDEPSGNAPQLPPKETMALPNFDKFPSGKTDETQGLSHFYAAAGVGIWNTILAINLVLPVAAFAESFNHTPFYKDGAWNWAYAVNVNNVIHLANLQAIDNGTTIEWKMLISKQGEYSDLVWFTGTSAKDGKNGSWTLMKDPVSNIPYIGIEWTKENDKIGNIKFSNLIPGDPGKDSYIHAGLTADTQYNAFYTIFTKNDNNMANIEWNTLSANGRIKSPYCFQRYVHWLNPKRHITTGHI
jgi:hypothetical protein